MFFIYDHTLLKKEEDDLKDAIVFFHPPSTPVDTQCGICGQLMGMMLLFKTLMGSHPKLFKTKNQNFAVKYLGKYTLALGGNGAEDLLLVQVDRLYSLFVFYQNSLEQFYEDPKNLITNNQQWITYINFIRHYGNKVTAAFQSLPYTELPKKKGQLIVLQSNHLLEHCTKHFPVYAGCILYKNSVLCTQLSPDMTFRLLLIGPQLLQNVQETNQEVTEDESFLPEGVHILPAYLTQEEYKQLCHSIKEDSSVNTQVVSTKHNDNQTTKSKNSTGFQFLENIEEGMAVIDSKLGDEPTPSLFDTSAKDVESKMSTSCLEESIKLDNDKVVSDLRNSTDQIMKKIKTAAAKINNNTNFLTNSKENTLITKVTVVNDNLVSSTTAMVEDLERCTVESSTNIIDDNQQNLLIKASVPEHSDSSELPYSVKAETIPCGTVHSSVEATNCQSIADVEINNEFVLVNTETFQFNSKEDGSDLTPSHLTNEAVNFDEKQTQNKLDGIVNKFSSIDIDVQKDDSVSSNSLNSKLQISEDKELYVKESPPVLKIESTQTSIFKEKNIQQLLVNDSSNRVTDLNEFSSTNTKYHVASKPHTGLDVDPNFRDPGDNVLKTTEIAYTQTDPLLLTLTEENSPQDCANVCDTDESLNALESEQTSWTDFIKYEKECNVPTQLYVQGNSEMIVVLLMKKSSNDSKLIEQLWKNILPQLADLEVKLKMCFTKPHSKKSSQEVLSYNYLQFDGLKRSLSGKIAVSEKSESMSADETHFCESAVNLHSMFSRQTQLKDCTLRNSSSVVYGHNMMSQETYFQKILGRAVSDAPSEKDSTLLIDRRAKDRLYKDQGLNIV